MTTKSILIETKIESLEEIKKEIDFRINILKELLAEED